MAAESPYDPHSMTFRAGTYVFTRGDAVHLAHLYRHGATVRELQGRYHPNASLREMIVAIQVGIRSWRTPNLAEINPAVFEPRHVALEMWKIGVRTHRGE